MASMTHYACFSCRVSFKKPRMFGPRGEQTCDYPCPNCARSMQCMGLTFRSPRKQAIRKWRVVELLVRYGFWFGYKKGRVPTTAREIDEVLQSGRPHRAMTSARREALARDLRCAAWGAPLNARVRGVRGTIAVAKRKQGRVQDSRGRRLRH